MSKSLSQGREGGGTRDRRATGALAGGPALSGEERAPEAYAGVHLAPLRDGIGEWLAALDSGAPLPPRPPRIGTAGEGAP